MNTHEDACTGSKEKRQLLRNTSRISNVGICGRKSLPTKKHKNTKSSTKRSKLVLNGGLGISRSYCRYSLNTQMLRNCKSKFIMIMQEKQFSKHRTKKDTYRLFDDQWLKPEKSTTKPGIFSCEWEYHLPNFHLTFHFGQQASHDNQLPDDQLDHSGNISLVAKAEWQSTWKKIGYVPERRMKSITVTPKIVT